MLHVWNAHGASIRVAYSEVKSFTRVPILSDYCSGGKDGLPREANLEDIGVLCISYLIDSMHACRAIPAGMWMFTQ